MRRPGLTETMRCFLHLKREPPLPLYILYHITLLYCINAMRYACEEGLVYFLVFLAPLQLPSLPSAPALFLNWRPPGFNGKETIQPN